jgi:hypothetical protein
MGWLVHCRPNPPSVNSKQPEIQHGLVGDDLSGLFKILKVGDIPMIENGKTDQKSEDDK